MEGDNAGSIAAGIGYYLSHVANASISWSATGGDNIEEALPKNSLPPLPGNAAITRSALGNALRYYFNTCTVCVCLLCVHKPRIRSLLPSTTNATN